MARKPALGRGISALIPEYPEGTPAGEDTRQIVYLRVDQIEPNPFQPRASFDEKSIDELMRSIQQRGVIQPITVTRVGQTYQIVAGERRWRATRKAGIETIPAILRQVESQQELMELTLIENIQREDLNAIEEAEGYRALMDRCFLTQDDVAQRVGKDRSTVANTVRLLRLPPQVQDYLRTDQLQMGHARALLGLEEDADRLGLAERAVRDKMTVREVEEAVSARRTQRGPRRRPSPRGESRDPHIADFEERLRHQLGTAVAIRRTSARRGRIEVDFYDDDDLERILDLLLGRPG